MTEILKNSILNPIMIQNKMGLLLSYNQILILKLFGYRMNFNVKWNQQKTNKDFLFFLRNHPKTKAMVYKNNKTKELFFDIVLYDSEHNIQTEQDFIEFYKSLKIIRKLNPE